MLRPRLRLAAMLLLTFTAVPACGGGGDEPVTSTGDPVADLQNAANKGPTGVLSHTRDVADQLNQRNADLDSLAP